jgi:hypothetical protein
MGIRVYGEIDERGCGRLGPAADPRSTVETVGRRRFGRVETADGGADLVLLGEPFGETGGSGGEPSIGAEGGEVGLRKGDASGFGSGFLPRGRS